VLPGETGVFVGDVDYAGVPEPGVVSLSGLALTVLALRRRRVA